MFVNISICIKYSCIKKPNTFIKIKGLQGNKSYKFDISGTVQFTRMFIHSYKNIFYTYTLSEDGFLLYVNLTLYFLPVTLLRFRLVLVCRFRSSSDDLQSLQVILTLHHDIFVSKPSSIMRCEQGFPLESLLTNCFQRHGHIPSNQLLRLVLCKTPRCWENLISFTLEFPIISAVQQLYTSCYSCFSLKFTLSQLLYLSLL